MYKLHGGLITAYRITNRVHDGAHDQASVWRELTEESQSGTQESISSNEAALVEAYITALLHGIRELHCIEYDCSYTV